MRKIGTEKELDSKKKFMVSLISIILLIILLFGTVGYAFLSGTGSTPNNPTTPEGATVFEGQYFYFAHTPEETSEIPVEISSNLNSFVNTPLYFSINNSAISNEVLQFLGKYSSRVQQACYGECTEDFPEKDCKIENMIVWKDSPDNKVYQQEKCIFINGDLRAADAFIYRLMQN